MPQNFAKTPENRNGHCAKVCETAKGMRHEAREEEVGGGRVRRRAREPAEESGKRGMAMAGWTRDGACKRADKAVASAVVFILCSGGVERCTGWAGRGYPGGWGSLSWSWDRVGPVGSDLRW
jgi:hypothetical protein